MRRVRIQIMLLFGDRSIFKSIGSNLRSSSVGLVRFCNSNHTLLGYITRLVTPSDLLGRVRRRMPMGSVQLVVSVDILWNSSREIISG